MEWAMRKKGIPEKIVRDVMSLYQGAKVRVATKLSEEFPVKGFSRETPGVSVITIVVCNCGGCGYKERKRMLGERNSICRRLGFDDRDYRGPE